jgi:hypothetical protein
MNKRLLIELLKDLEEFKYKLENGIYVDEKEIATILKKIKSVRKLSF